MTHSVVCCSMIVTVISVKPLKTKIALYLNVQLVLRSKHSACYKQDRQCTCNIILRRVHETTVAVEKQ